MKNTVKDQQNIDNYQKNKIKAKSLKKLSLITITIDLITFTAIEILKLIYHNKDQYIKELIFFIANVL